jgi:hypothetical protein
MSKLKLANSLLKCHGRKPVGIYYNKTVSVNVDEKWIDYRGLSNFVYSW